MAECGCGRSPTGKCVGWHGLSEEQYQEKKQPTKPDRPLNPQRIKLIGRMRGPFFSHATLVGT